MEWSGLRNGTLVVTLSALRTSKKWYSSGDSVSTESIMEWSELRNGTLVVTLSALRTTW